MIFIPSLILMLIFGLYQKKNRGAFGPISYLILVYLIMAATSVFVYFSGLFPSVFPITVNAMAYLSLCFVVIFYGFTVFKDRKFTQIVISNTFWYRLLELTLIYGGLGAILFFLPFAIAGLTGDIMANRINNLEFQKTVLAGYGLVNSIFTLFANLFILAIVFAFINLARGAKYKKRAFLLLLSSLSYVIYVLAYVGRDGVIYWFMSFLFVLFLMKGFLDEITKRKIIRMFYVISVIIIIPFISITIARFSYRDNPIAWETANYLGQQVGNFNDLFELNPPLSYGKSIFPLFAEWMGKLGVTSTDSSTESQQDFYFYRNGVTTWIFKTYIGSFLSNFGRIGTIVILISLTIICRGILKRVIRTKSFTISRLIIFILLFQNVLWGVFYFRLALNNFYILAVVFLSLFFKYFLSRSNQSQIIIHKFKDI